ncbi:hypothetical protein [Neobacillus ginsengisoli]|uniref:Uncharacterized protein n=1 Tax=Neobacillus ginsengisoli TaxID=904295 RepID=A0ABT9Y1T4_9BACI|nr:hypothetical protein [Neobacillus ginsengisoli]MDQ0201104.1 hypothetical protein [Neobacillus ginsengisoli]
MRQRGLIISKLEGEKGRTNWLNTVDQDCAKQAIGMIPFSYHLSKNHIWTLNEGGHRQQRAEQNEKQSDLSEKIIEAVKDITFTEGKIWLDIFVQAGMKKEH